MSRDHYGNRRGCGKIAVFRMLAEGATSDQIAAAMGLSPRTLEVYTREYRIGGRDEGGGVARCAKCGLAEPHECLKGDATARTGELAGGGFMTTASGASRGAVS